MVSGWRKHQADQPIKRKHAYILIVGIRAQFSEVRPGQQRGEASGFRHQQPCSTHSHCAVRAAQSALLWQLRVQHRHTERVLHRAFACNEWWTNDDEWSMIWAYVLWWSIPLLLTSMVKDIKGKYIAHKYLI